MTLQEKFALALMVRGETEVNSKSQRYRTFTRKKGGYYFLGKSGALRVGTRSSRSIPVSEKFKELLLDMDTM